MPGSIFPWQVFCLDEAKKRYTALESMKRERKSEQYVRALTSNSGEKEADFISTINRHRI